MDKTNAIIEIWKNWSPDAHFVAPYQVVGWFWDEYLHHNGLKPLFPDGEIHDLAAVIAGAKPCAIMDLDGAYACRTYDCDEIAIGILEIALENGLVFKIIKEQNVIIFAKEDGIADEIEKAMHEIGNEKFRKIGSFLGYPNEAIECFIENLKNTSIKEEHVSPKIKIEAELFESPKIQ